MRFAVLSVPPGVADPRSHAALAGLKPEKARQIKPLIDLKILNPF
jgi:hypothetical protein